MIQLVYFTFLIYEKKKGGMNSGRAPGCLRLPSLPSVHIKIHSFSLFEPAEVGSHLCLLHGLTLQVAQALHKLDALVILAAHKRLFGCVQIQFLKSCFSQ